MHNKFPRTQREAGWYAQTEWEGKEDGSGWAAIILTALVSAVVLWMFFVLVLA
jgi:hypothetical protein